MAFYDIDKISPEFVTPQHSTAFGALVSGQGIEVGVFSYRQGEGANPHAHPQEQILVVLSGRVRFTLGEEVRVLTARQVVHIPPMIPHRLEALEATEVVSSKTMIDGIGHRLHAAKPSGGDAEGL